MLLRPYKFTYMDISVDSFGMFDLDSTYYHLNVCIYIYMLIQKHVCIYIDFHINVCMYVCICIYGHMNSIHLKV
jgi:hypothetical protein